MRARGRSLWVFLRSEDGPSAVEYAVLLALIVPVALAAIHLMRGHVRLSFDSLGDAMTTPP
jgi:pilus assembly protein Flp/PilA